MDTRLSPSEEDNRTQKCTITFSSTWTSYNCHLENRESSTEKQEDCLLWYNYIVCLAPSNYRRETRELSTFYQEGELSTVAKNRVVCCHLQQGLSAAIYNKKSCLLPSTTKIVCCHLQLKNILHSKILLPAPQLSCGKKKIPIPQPEVGTTDLQQQVETTQVSSEVNLLQQVLRKEHVSIKRLVHLKNIHPYYYPD